MFDGLTAYLHIRKTGAPKKFFWNWLKEKWKADLWVLLWIMIFWPVLIFRAILILLEMFVDHFLYWAPDLPFYLRDDQKKCVREYHQWLRENDKIHLLKNRQMKRDGQ